ncbi:MAG: hormogonium polysaccharide biosynthesis glycosyltransferase HpsE [Jaaginema sp. PMC 1079.18]|nr:hormogonium polysaccharide biosynthesis glycosyltransferase HpsE [Jaaginema sp. PMC 1080.18]MEC4850914.1 hormogonium polysaccharide biosynthesis glycosyltransferase HpsE [Jaaginema sp. PMC 1079.18]MEC4865557.1 hormogonium polysaccharide biosynthesis glycosyltransferase HpsE [Jaaginema sp. PMC 1078.18]
MSIDLTIAIPTYNGATRLGLVLDRLGQQIGVDSISWEILIVDNNSRDNTAQVVQQYQAAWPHQFPLRYSRETQQGAAFARLKAIQLAQGDLIGFLDDDTPPAPNWAAEALKFARMHPQAGAIGSQIHGDYEVDPPPEFERIASFFAITERGKNAHLYTPQMKMLPPSAGLVVRKEAWLECVPERPFLRGRSRGSILNSEDLEAILSIQNGGWEVWYNPAMEIWHQIPKERLTRDYLLFLVRSTGLARHHIRMLRFAKWQRPLVFPVAWLRDLQRAIFYYLKYHQTFEQNPVNACEMEFLRSSLMSPFYLWRQSLK